MTDHAFINVIVPFESGYSRDVNKTLCGLTAKGCGNQPNADIECRMYEIGVVHFMSITVADPVCPAERDGPPGNPVPADAKGTSHLIIEISADGGAAEVLGLLADKLGLELKQILAAADVAHDGQPLATYLLEHHVVIKAPWGSGALGQIFSGSPGQSARRINDEATLAARIETLIDRHRRSAAWTQSSPRQRLEQIRDDLWEEDGAKWAFVPEKTPCIAAAPNGEPKVSNPQIWKAAGSIFNSLFWPLYLPFLTIFAASFWLTVFRHGPDIGLLWAADAVFGLVAALVVTAAAAFGPKRFWLRLVLLVLLVLALTWRFHDAIVEAIWLTDVLAGLFIGAIVALAVLGAAAFARLRRLESTDRAQDRTPGNDHVAELMAVENFCAQNHLASISRLKPGLLRRLTLRLAFIVVGTGRFVCAPGFLGKNGVIHFARWMRLPGTDQMLFWSNYDGTWEAYVADFIADAPTGVTAIWSNCIDFPRTSKLFGAGAATERDRLVRWARRQQHPTLFWYSAYRDLTATRIRINAAIRQGLASAESDADVRDWFALFGSRPRPADELQVTQIPTLVFGGLSSLPFASCHLITFAADGPRCKQWLATVAADATYGEAPPGQKSALVVALSATGLKKLGLPDDALATFPVAFQQGIWPEARARELGDTGKSTPDQWNWGSKEKPADAIVVVYGWDEPTLKEVEQKLGAATGAHGHTSIPIALKPRPPKYVEAEDGTLAALPAEFPKEAFGFADGISQPVIRGTARSKTCEVPNDLVAPGEIVLGYPDNLGSIPPSPSIEDKHDPEHFLPDVGSDPFRQRPEFASYEGLGSRDLGANGTFLVVRQLRQEVTEFRNFLKDAVKQVEPDVIVAKGGGRIALLWGNAAQDRSATPLPRPRTDELAPFDWNDPSDRQQVCDAIAAKLVGRWQDGTSLVRHPLGPGTLENPPAAPDNDFLLGAEDPTGLRCPFGSHIRRANPRDTRFPGSSEEIAATNRHRILRVGRSYEVPRGGRFQTIGNQWPRGRAAVHVPQCRYRAAVRVHSEDLDSEPEYPGSRK